MELRHVWQILWKRKWIIVQSFVIVTLIAVVGSEFAPEIYSAQAKVWVPEETSQSAILSLFGLKALSQTYPFRIPLKEEMKNRTILATLASVYEEVVWKLQLRTADGDLVSPRSLKGQGPFYNLDPQPKVGVDSARDAAFLTMTGMSADAEEAQMLANAMADSYMRANERMLRDETRVGRSFASEQVGEVSKLYDIALDEYLAFQEREGTVNLPMETQIAIRRVTDLIKERERSIIKINEAEAKLVHVKDQLDAQSLALWTEASGTTSGDPELTRLTGQWTKLKIQLRDTLIERTESHPIVDIMKQQIEAVETELRERLELYEMFSPLVVGLKRDIVADYTHLEGIEEDIAAHMEELAKLPEKALREARLKLKTDSYEAIYSSLLKYEKRLGLAEAISLEDVKIVEKAPLPRSPVLPDKSKNRNLGMLFGLLMGVALAFLVEHLDDRFNVPGDVREREALPLLGVIPFLGAPRKSIRDTRGRGFEAYRAVRHGLKNLLSGRLPRSVAVLSAASGEGRSLVAANIAVSFSREGKSVVLLDADLRNPSQHKIFGVGRSPGVEDVASGAASIEEALKETGIDGLKLLPCGEPVADPAARIESEGMARLIEDLEKKFDVVVADTPPLLCVADGKVVAGMMETSIIVYESRRTTAKMAEAAKHDLEGARVRPAGVVLNKYKADRLAFVSYGYERAS